MNVCRKSIYFHLSLFLETVFERKTPMLETETHNLKVVYHKLMALNYHGYILELN